MAKGVVLEFTADALRAAYIYLAETPPFKQWNLPDGDDVAFHVVRDPALFAFYRWDGRRHSISVSSRCVGSTSILMQKMAHEIVHLHLGEMGMDKRGTVNTHNGAFRKLAADVCRIHGWDAKAFC